MTKPKKDPRINENDSKPGTHSNVATKGHGALSHDEITDGGHVHGGIVAKKAEVDGNSGAPAYPPYAC